MYIEKYVHGLQHTNVQCFGICNDTSVNRINCNKTTCNVTIVLAMNFDDVMCDTDQYTNVY